VLVERLASCSFSLSLSSLSPPSHPLPLRNRTDGGEADTAEGAHEKPETRSLLAHRSRRQFRRLNNHSEFPWCAHQGTLGGKFRVNFVENPGKFRVIDPIS